MTGPGDEPEGATVDARGQRCPLPVLGLARAAKDARDGQLLTVLSSDPAAEPDIGAWCRMRGHELVEQAWSPHPEGAVLTSRVRVRRRTDPVG
jgi:tRNA 2-thiouridine synthesizing protein A